MGSKINKIIGFYWRELSSVRDSLFLFLASWTAMVLLMGWTNFLVPTLPLPDVAVTSYLILLGIYILHKEVNRWSGTKTATKPGELIVYIWWLSFMMMVAISFFTKLQVPEAIKFMSYEILGALLVSEISKNINIYKLKQSKHSLRSGAR